ncbi:MAG: type II toxin-antitoxin system death-on-curing family toxin [Candidatus Methanoperedens sp.]
MIDLTTQKIILIHDIIIELDKGTSDYSPGVRDLGTLEHLIEFQISPNNSVFLNAAFALDSITNRHAFNNGNKRTGFGVASIILESERYHVTASRADRMNFLLKIARYETTVEDIEHWLKENTYKMNNIQFKLHTIKNDILYYIFKTILKIFNSQKEK